MSESTKQAREKLDAEVKAFKGNQYGTAVYKDLAATLKQFCGEEWFAQAILKNKKMLSDCCETILSDVEDGISDIEVYKRAVEFYVPGSTVKCQMQVVRSRDDAQEFDSRGVISLLDLL